MAHALIFLVVCFILSLLGVPEARSRMSIGDGEPGCFSYLVHAILILILIAGVGIGFILTVIR